MLFNTIEFWLFFSIVWLAVRHASLRRANLILLAASYIFYAAWDVRFVSLIVISTIVDFFAGQYASRTRPNGQSNGETLRRVALITSMTVNLTILGVFKYFDFFVVTCAEFLQIPDSAYAGLLLDVILPVGISFYTFQTMSYTVDVYRGKLQPADRFTDFALYVAFFPQLVAGPIERGERFLPQVQRDRPQPRIQRGAVLLISWGLFKKMVIADTLSGPVDVVYASEACLGPEIYVATLCFAIQIYCDFSGYTDIARGIAKLLGFDLMLNFNLPYFATSPADFWRRWHISLSTWLRDYLYIPLGGNRHGQLFTYRNLMITMMLGGLWHGARMNFVLWGVYHGGILALHRYFSRRREFPKEQGVFLHCCKVLGMFHLTLFGWLLFRVTSWQQLVRCMNALMGPWNSWDSSLAIIRFSVPVVIPLVIMQVCQLAYRDLDVIQQAPKLFQTAFVATCLASCLYLNRSAGTPFIYFQF